MVGDWNTTRIAPAVASHVEIFRMQLAPSAPDRVTARGAPRDELSPASGGSTRADVSTCPIEISTLTAAVTKERA
jgi:hypothetical protein